MCRNVVQIGMAEGFVIVAGGNSIHPVFGLGEDLHGAGSVSGFCEDGFAIEEHQDRFHNLSEGVTDDANACGLTNGANANLIESDPNLGPLADNGDASCPVRPPLTQATTAPAPPPTSAASPGRRVQPATSAHTNSKYSKCKFNFSCRCFSAR
jgi:hypothetical protein